MFIYILNSLLFIIVLFYLLADLNYVAEAQIGKLIKFLFFIILHAYSLNIVDFI